MYVTMLNCRPLINNQTFTPVLGNAIAMRSRPKARQHGSSSGRRSPEESKSFAHCHLFPACDAHPCQSRKSAGASFAPLTLRVHVLTIPLSPSVIIPASRSIQATAVTCILCANLANSVRVFVLSIRTLLSKPVSPN